ncbi:MAG: S8 family serine peptidase, partial [Acidimicrobiaceae bacterium]|nr:S8 family serine peptidase [Acidimicrobiaceae bacterium]
MVAGASSATAAQAAARAAVAAPAFRDIGESGMHQPSVEALAGLGVLNGTGCDPERLCPRDPLPRWEMAVWVVRVRQLPGLGQVSGSRFTDVDAHLWWARHVEVLAQSAITTGCATRPLRFCPEQRVTRAEMASFLMRTFDLDPAPEAGFVDVERGVHAAAIDALRASGITAGCGTGPLRYCPGDSVTRAEMASFLARAMGIVELPRNSDSRALEPLSDQTLSKVGDAARMIRERRSDTLRLNSQGAPDCPPQAAPTGVPDEVEVLRVVDGCMRVAYERLNGRTLDEFRLRIAGDPTVLTVDRPVTVEFSQSPGGDDPRSGEQWFLDAVDARALWAGWPAGAEVKVAVIDTGVDGTHQDLVSSLLPGKGRVPGSDDPDDGRVDPDGHGTHVAGIVAAEAQNGLNGAGVAPRAKVVPIKIDLLGAPSEIDSYDVVRYASGALSDAVNLRSDVINMSWGSYGSSATLCAALRVAHELGIVTVASAGNDAEDASGHYPSGYDTVIAVAAASARQDGSLADFSNYGGGVVVAPGETILSTAPGNQMTYARGTSMAAPIVSAVAAHIKARWPGADPDEIRDAIEQTALLRPGERADRLGHGHIQPLAAIAYLSELLGPPAEPPPGPPSGPPSAPGAPLLTPGDSRIGVTWTPPDDNGDAITWYEIVAESTNEWSNTFAPGNTRSATITGLTNNIAYGVQVRAWNGQGPGEWSPGSVATPEPDALPPEAPGAPLLTPGDSRIGVTW